ncbi:MAG: hypothetical protein HZA69_02050 [Gammaproteobacteria bacterium]|nr:hypothetical protein [Gammaproteobacteria bacterium]
MSGRCPFEKAILSAPCACELATRFSVAEQMGVNCRSGIARNNCATLLALMRERARFALKVTDTSDRLPFGKEMKVMIGGLIGLQGLLMTESDATRVNNIHALVQQAQEKYSSLESLLYQEIVKSITAFQTRHRGHARPKS